MATLTFFSTLRFKETDGRSIRALAIEMKKALEEYEGVFVYVCNVGNGDSIQRDIIKNYDEADTCIIYGTETYGRETTEVAISTYSEMTLIKEDKKHFFLLKMCERFQETATRLNFHAGIAYEECISWTSGPPPAELVAKILKEAAARKRVPVPVKRSVPMSSGSEAEEQTVIGEADANTSQELLLMGDSDRPRCSPDAEDSAQPPEVATTEVEAETFGGPLEVDRGMGKPGHGSRPGGADDDKGATGDEDCDEKSNSITQTISGGRVLQINTDAGAPAEANDDTQIIPPRTVVVKTNQWFPPYWDGTYTLQAEKKNGRCWWLKPGVSHHSVSWNGSQENPLQGAWAFGIEDHFWQTLGNGVLPAQEIHGRFIAELQFKQ